jgi:AcrR family transcriptional regulator
MQNSDLPTTRTALLDAGLRLFGQNGYEATSTRQIAALAGANIGSISYHFGGKSGLHQACADHVSERISEMAAKALGDQVARTPAEAEERLAALVSGFVHLMVQPEAENLVAFVLREIMTPGAALDRFFERFAGPVHRRACQLWATATGADAESEDTRLAIFAMLGQIIYFRIAQPFVLKRMDWREMGPRETRQLSGMLQKNLKSAIAAARRS